MKRLFALTLIALALATTGCKSFNNNLGPIAQLASYTGSSIDLNKNPNHCTNYVAVIGNLTVLDMAGVYDLGSFTVALQPLPVKQLEGPNGTLILGGSAILLNLAGSNLLGTNQANVVKPILQGTKIGLTQAVLEHPCK